MDDADKNAESVRRGYAAFNTAGMKTLTELFTKVLRGIRRGEAHSPATTKAVTRSLPTSANWVATQQALSGPHCRTYSNVTTAA